MRTAFAVAVAVVAFLAMPTAVAGAPAPRDKPKSDNRVPGNRIERSVPEPATILLLGAAAGVAYGVRKLRSKRR
jgi:PEP-CTERM motif